jgi:enamine deaminase RidA (YjgF/YER057c/UK114 family)
VEGQMTSAHRVVNPHGLAPATGFSHVVVPASGRLVFLGGQTAHDSEGNVVGRTVVEQFDRAAANVVTALSEVQGRPEDLVSLHVFVTDAAAYRASLGDLGGVYRKHFGRHYPAVALFEVKGLLDPDAVVELVAIAVIPAEERDYRAIPPGGFAPAGPDPAER